MKAQVYVIVAHVFVKVGMSTDINKRIQSMETDCPHPLAVIWSSEQMTVKKARNLESIIHDRLYEYHAKGEWFKVSHIKAVDEAHKAERFMNTVNADQKRYDPNVFQGDYSDTV